MHTHLWELPLTQAVKDAANVNSAWIAWRDMVAKFIHDAIPQRTVTHHPNNKPWYASYHHRLRRSRDRLFAAAKRANSSSAWTMYRFVRNACTAALRKAKRQYYQRIADRLQDDKGSYKWWKLAKTACGISRPSMTLPDLHQNGKVAKTDMQKADMLADLFESFSSSSASQLASTSLPMPTVGQSDEKFSLTKLTPMAVFQSLCRLSPHRSTAGSIASRVLREAAEELAQSLTALFNRSIESCTVPSEWKTASHYTHLQRER